MARRKKWPPRERPVLTEAKIAAIRRIGIEGLQLWRACKIRACKRARTCRGDEAYCGKLLEAWDDMLYARPADLPLPQAARIATIAILTGKASLAPETRDAPAK
jgi:hypothetical protein